MSFKGTLILFIRTRVMGNFPYCPMSTMLIRKTPGQTLRSYEVQLQRCKFSAKIRAIFLHFAKYHKACLSPPLDPRVCLFLSSYLFMHNVFYCNTPSQLNAYLVIFWNQAVSAVRLKTCTFHDIYCPDWSIVKFRAGKSTFGKLCVSRVRKWFTSPLVRGKIPPFPSRLKTGAT